MFPAVNEGEPISPRLAIELGPLRLVADSRVITAVHERNPLIVCTVPMPGDGPLTSTRLMEAIPPIPVPQLDLVQAPDPVRPPLLTPYARSVNWTAVAPDARAPGRFTLTGTSDRGTVSMVVRAGQIQALDVRDESRGVTLRLQHSPLLPCREQDAEIDVTGRTPVPSLSDLQPRSGVLRQGSPVPDMQLTTSAGQVQRLRELLGPPPDVFPAPTIERLVLLFVRYPKDLVSASPDAGRLDLGAAARALARLQREALTYGPASEGTGGSKQPDAPLIPTFNYVMVMVLEAPPPAEALLELIKREQRVWNGPALSRGEAGPGPSEGFGGDHLAWTTDARSSIELFAGPRESGSVAVILDDRQSLRSVITITERTTAEGLMDQITAALLEGAD